MAGGQTFVLVHGAFHGGWCWARVADILRARGHRVTTPTQTGLGERSHLMSPDIDITVFTDDVVNHILWEDLAGIVLVGHSFGGNAISGAAERVPGRIDRLVYLDSVLPESGRTPFDAFHPDLVATRLKQAEEASGGLWLPTPKADVFGVTDPADAAWVEAKMTPHPLRTYTTSQVFRNGLGNGLPAEYIVCNDPIYGPLDGSRGRARTLDWPIREIATGHDAMVTAPVALSDMLEAG